MTTTVITQGHESFGKLAACPFSRNEGIIFLQGLQDVQELVPGMKLSKTQYRAKPWNSSQHVVSDYFPDQDLCIPV